MVIDPDLLDACPDLQAGQGMISLSRLHHASGSVLSVQVRLPSSDTVRNFFTNRPDFKVSPSFGDRSQGFNSDLELLDPLAPVSANLASHEVKFQLTQLLAYRWEVRGLTSSCHWKYEGLETPFVKSGAITGALEVGRMLTKGVQRGMLSV